jgi:hypothetical protein
MTSSVHSFIGFLQHSALSHLQYLQHLISATLQGHPFFLAHLPHVQGSGRPPILEIIKAVNSNDGVQEGFIEEDK